MDQRFAARARWLVPFALVLATAGLWAASQSVGQAFGYPHALGEGVARWGGGRVYAPWSILAWYGRYAGTDLRVFDRALLSGAGVFLWPLMLVIGLTRRFVARPKAFGLDVWGGLPEAQRAGLLHGDHLVGRVLGRLKGRLLTFTGVEHCIIVGASRSGKGAGHVVPTVLTWDQSLLIYDRKGEL